MASTSPIIPTDFECSLISKPVTIGENVVYLTGGEPLLAVETLGEHCSGMPICRLFEPTRTFPLIERVVVATGCPYIDARRLAGR
jgi:hypothetical protein